MDDETKDLLDSIIEEDLDGIFNSKEKVSNTVTTNNRLIEGFQKINDFYKKHDRKPSEFSDDVTEKKLYWILEGILENEKKKIELKEFDFYNLLFENQQILSIEDILNDNELVDNNDLSLFNLKHVKHKDDREEADFVAKRKKCENFDKYKSLFQQIHTDLKENKRKLIKYNDKDDKLKVGKYYVLSGVLVYLETVDFISEEKTINGIRYRKDGRTYCVFENGTESNMLYRSLAKGLLKDGYFVTEHNNKLLENLNPITEDDEQLGFIYVLKSLSEDISIKEIDNLYKIGFSRVPVKDRVKNAEKDPTYLMAPVKIIQTYKCYNMNPQKLELILHKFFNEACLKLDIYDEKRNRHSPREWFSIPINVIEEAINLIITEKIVNYKYDSGNQKLVLN